MNLFSRLRRLHPQHRFPLEDFHTEIVAQVLRESTPLTLAWLRDVEATSLVAADTVSIDTQERFAALAGHDVDSRPDIAIRLFAGSRKELILVESKIDSSAGWTQLERYLDHLK